MATRRGRPAVRWKTLFAELRHKNKPVEYGANCKIFQQGQPANSLLYLRRGKVRLTVISKQGKEATLALLSAGEFFGEGCLAGQRERMATATAMTACTLHKFGKLLMTHMLHERHEISELFVSHLLSRNLRYEANLVDRFFNPTEMRLAQILLLHSRFGQESKGKSVVPTVSQADLAQMIGTTRSRVRHFMNKLRSIGFIEYGNNGDLIVQSGLLSMVLHD